MSNFTASDVLLKAASRIEEEGMWCQSRFYGDIEGELSFVAAWQVAELRRHRTSECAYGALMIATVELGLLHADFIGAEKRLSAVIHDNYGEGIAQWNDRVGRVAQEVADAMREAAERFSDD